MSTQIVNMQKGHDHADMILEAKKNGTFVRIDRRSKWGNPFVIGKDGTRDEVIAKYRKYIQSKPELLSSLLDLNGKTLGCWCKPNGCHGDVLAELSDEYFAKMSDRVCEVLPDLLNEI